jgi:hypothetical protein
MRFHHRQVKRKYGYRNYVSENDYLVKRECVATTLAHQNTEVCFVILKNNKSLGMISIYFVSSHKETKAFG